LYRWFRANRSVKRRLKFGPNHEDRHLVTKGHAVPEFCPDGYVSTQQAIATAAERWFVEQVQKLKKAMQSQPERKPEGHIEQAVRAFSGPEFPEEFRQLASQTVLRMRSLLHRGELTAYYFDNQGRHSVPRNFWGTAEADGILESGVCWPFGKPSRVFESRLHYELFIQQLELDRLLSEETTRKRPLPQSKIRDLVAALRGLNHLPNRAAQLQALRELPEFREYEITHAVFRQAARNLPRKSGQRSREES
jgi:hypothetical protein